MTKCEIGVAQPAIQSGHNLLYGQNLEYHVLNVRIDQEMQCTMLDYYTPQDLEIKIKLQNFPIITYQPLT